MTQLVTDIQKHVVNQESHIIEQALSILERWHRPGEVLTSPSRTAQYLQLKIADCKSEVFGAIFMTSKNQVLDIRTLFQGTINAATVHPRLIVQHGLELNAASVILYHNHPSGDPIPSESDKQTTHRIKDALSLIDIRVIDHMIVTLCRTISFAELGLL